MNAFKYAAPVSGALGYSIEDTSIAIGLMSNAGIKGQKAGTALRTMFTNLSKPTKAMKTKMEELGISITDSNGEMIPMRDLMDQLREKMGGLSKDQQAAAAATIFGKEAMSGSLAIINASDESYEKLTHSIDNSSGAAKRMADTMEEGIGGKLRRLLSQLEELAISIFKALEPALMALAEGLIKVVEVLNKMPKSFKITAATIGLIGIAIGPVLFGMSLFVAALHQGSLVLNTFAMSAAKGGLAMKVFGKTAQMSSLSFGLFGRALKALPRYIINTGGASSKASGAVGGLSRTAGKSTGIFARLGATFAGVKGSASLVGLAMRGVGSALRFMLGPIGWTITAITLLYKGFKYAYTNVKWFRDGVNGAVEIVKVFSKGIGGAMLSGLKNLGGWLDSVGNKAKEFGKNMWEAYKKTEDGKKTMKGWGELTKGVKGAFDGMAQANKKASDTTKVLGKDISKGTRQALQKYVDFSEGSIRAIEKIKINGGKLNKETQKELSDSIKKGGAEAVNAVKERNKKIESNLRKALENSTSISEEEKQNIIKKTQEASDKKVEKLEKLNKEISELEKKQYTDGKLTAEESKLLKSKLEERNKMTVKYVAKGAEEQQAILSRMDANASGLSNQEISEALKDSAKAEKKAIEEAAKIRNEGVKEADRALADGSINKNEHRSIVLDLESDYNDAVDTANKKTKEVQKSVEKGNKGIWKEMNKQGETYTGAQKMWNDFSSAFMKYWGSGSAIGDTLTGWWNKYVDTFTSLGNKAVGWIGKPFSALGSKIGSWWNQGVSETKISWSGFIQKLGSAYGSVAGWFVGLGHKMWNGIKTGWDTSVQTVGNWWNGLTQKLSETWGATKQWFSQTGSRMWGAVKQGWTTAVETTGNLLSGLIGKLGEWWETTKGFFSGLGRKMGGALKQGWNAMMTGVGSFFGNLWQTIQTGMATVKSILFTLWQSITTTVVNIVQGMGRGIGRVFGGIWSTAQNIFGTLRGWLTTLWTTLKNTVVNLALGMWRGVRGNFINLWNTTKNIFTTLKGWLQTLWYNVKNYVVGRAQLLWSGVRNAFIGLWNTTKNIFNTLRSWLYNLWIRLRNYVVNRAISLWSGVKNAFVGLWNSTKNIFNTIRSWLYNLWIKLRNYVVNRAMSLWSGVREAFTGLWNSVKNIIGTLRDWVIDAWDYIRFKVSDMAERVKDGVTSPFYKMKDIVEDVLDSTKGFIDDLTSKVKSGLNKVIDGMNKVGSFIGIDAKIPKLHTGTHSTHTQDFITNGAINKDTMAVVGDKGRGNGPGGFRHEMIEDNKGNLSLTPNKDTVVPLKKGYKVHNGRSTHDFLSSMFGSNIPKFAGGTFLGGIKKKKDDLYSYLAGKAGKGMGKVSGKAAAGFEKAIGDIDDWMDKPKKLLEKMFEHFDIDQFKGVSGNIGDLTKGMFKRLKKGLVEKIKDWFEEAEGSGDGDASWLLKYDQLQPFGWYKGGLMFNGGRHYGLDYGMPTGTKIRALTDGRITQAGPVSGGGGNQVELKEPGGKWFQWYMHMSKILTKKGAKVNAGDVIGLSGNTGNSTTPHLHIQRMKGYPSNDTAVDPTKWLEGLKGSGGGKKAANKWRGDVKRAAKAMKVNLSAGELNDIIRLIDTESSGDPKVMQGVHDVNSGPNAARGLLQYTPGTFNGYKVKGKGNILNGYHQLLAFFNNGSWRRNLKSWKSRMAMGLTGWGPTGMPRGYENGGVISKHQLVQAGEKNKPEMIIPLTKKARAMQLIDQAKGMMGVSSDGDLNIGSDNSRLEQKLDVLIEGISTLTQVVANKNLVIDRNSLTDDISKGLGRKYRNSEYTRGY